MRRHESDASPSEGDEALITLPVESHAARSSQALFEPVIPRHWRSQPAGFPPPGPSRAGESEAPE